MSDRSRRPDLRQLSFDLIPSGPAAALPGSADAVSGPVSRDPVLWTIPSGLPFLDTLARRILARYGGGPAPVGRRDPLGLAAVTVLLPTRRAALSLGEAFLRVGEGRPLLLPRFVPLAALTGDDPEGEELSLGSEVLDLPPALAAPERQFVLAKLVQRWGEGRGDRIPPAQALELAAELARFLDRMEAQGLPLSELSGLAPAEHAAHWQLTLRFLDILATHWPAHLREKGALDPGQRRSRLLAAQIETWRRTPPATPVVAAGIADADPAVRTLLGVVARLPAGELILPGLDRLADDETWAAIGRDDTHPQRGMAVLLDEIGWDRRAVGALGADGLPKVGYTEEPRQTLLRELMRPAETSERWQGLRTERLDRGGAISPDALDGISIMELPGPGDEAACIALLLRRVLERPGSTAMLVTPDRLLARRVAADLGRFGIDIDDSAGRPLAGTPPGVFLRLLATAAAAGWSPVPLLALLKHPLATGGRDPALFRSLVRLLERRHLRGSRPLPGLRSLRQRVAGEKSSPGEFAGEQAELLGLLDDLSAQLDPLATLAAGRHTLSDFLTGLIAAAEALAGPERLWAEEAGSMLARHLREVLAASANFDRIGVGDLPAVIDALLRSQTVRPAFGRHPRLRILGLMEARLQQADLVVLGGLVEGTWPAEPRADPWLSRPMAKALGLPAPEQRIGQAAHDWAQAVGCRRVVLTRAARVDGVPTVPSRWLMRLDTVCAAAGLGKPLSGMETLAIAGLLDLPAVYVSISRPAPTPPVAARPRRFSVTDVELWRRDPYGLYARRVLELRALKPLDEPLGRADLGTWIHEALASYLRASGDALPADPEALLLECGRRAFGRSLQDPEVHAFWWPAYQRMAKLVAGWERARRPGIRHSFVETPGILTVEAPAGPVRLEARADRIDRLEDGGAVLIDYKTGLVPSLKEVGAGFSPQLPLEAAILAAGGFEPIGQPGAEAIRMLYWKLGGRNDGAMTELEKPLELLQSARDGFVNTVRAFDDEQQPYPARPWPGREPAYSDYVHLARTAEWSGGSDSA